MKKPSAILLSLLCLASTLPLRPGSAQGAEIELLRQNAPLTERWRSLVQLNVTSVGSRMVSVGERGSVLISDDSGLNWRQVRTPVSCALVSVAFLDERTGWAAGHCGVVLKTTDGGETWTKVLDGIVAADIEQSAAEAEAVTADGDTPRVREARRLVSEGPDKPFLAIRFPDPQHVLVVGAFGLAFETSDGGQSWRSSMGRVSAGDGRHLYAIASLGDKIFLAGEEGTVLASDNGGLDYMPVPFPSRASQFGLISSGRALIAFGLMGSAYRSDDAGQNWSRIEFPERSLTAGLRLRDGGVLLGNEAGQIFRSDDDGATFREIQIANPAPITALAEAPDGAIVRAGIRGVSRVEYNKLEEKNAAR